MHCPRCGTTATTTQQFCRACGLNLERVAEIVGESITTPESFTDEIARLKDLQRKHESWGGLAGLVAFGLVLLLLVVIVFTQMIMKGGVLILLGSFFILLALVAGAMAYFQVSAKSLKEKLAQQPLPSTTPSLQNKTAQLSAPNSITEQTTELLSEERPSTRDTL